MGTELAPCPDCGEVHPEETLKCPNTDTALDLTGRLLDGKFRLLARLGSGGMADVWLATNLLVDKNVAIKLIRADFVRNEETLSRFRNEARAAGRIGNPHICDILDLGTSPIGPYIVMELLIGQSLADLITQEGRLEAPIAAAIARQALNGLSAAHDAGIVHRDLKPENIYLHRPEGARSVVKLMDFGVSKFTDGTSETETAQGVLLGTPQFMSPEQVRGAKNVDPRTDVWAMGAILYRALTGKDAFLGPTMAASLLNVAKEAHEPILDLVPDVPRGLVDVVERCLTRDLEQRYQTAREVSEALEPFAAIGPLPETTSSGAALMGAGSDSPTVAPPTARTTAVYEVEPVVSAAPTSSGPGWKLILGLGAGVLAGASAMLLGGDDGTPPTHAAGTRTEPAPSAVRDEDEPTPPAAEPAPGPTPTPTPTATAEPAGDPAGGGNAPAPPTPAPSPTSTPADPPAPSNIPGTIRADVFITPAGAPDAMEHGAARDHCKALADSGHLGVRDWKLANPAQIAKFAGNKQLKRGRWWSAANWRGKGRTVSIPGGKSSPTPLNRKHRPFCVSRVPG